MLLLVPNCPDTTLIEHVDAAVLARLIYTSTLWCSGFLADFMHGAHMKNFFEAARVNEVKERMALLRPDSERLWGKMNLFDLHGILSAVPSCRQFSAGDSRLGQMCIRVWYVSHT